MQQVRTFKKIYEEKQLMFPEHILTCQANEDLRNSSYKLLRKLERSTRPDYAQRAL